MNLEHLSLAPKYNISCYIKTIGLSICLLILTNQSINAQCPLPVHADYDALMALYNSTNGPGWTDNSGWIDGAAGTNCDPCTWYGITCTSAGVYQLNLSNNNLVGSIPPEIGDLFQFSNSNNNFRTSYFFSTLDLSFNSLSGPIPPEIGNLTDLNVLYLNNNQLSGSIPSELGNLNNLVLLSLALNQLSGTYDSNLSNLCPNYFSNANISDGNMLDGPWEGFCTAYVPCHPDYYDLMALYNSTNGPGWTNNNGWGNGGGSSYCDPCSWYGVLCTQDGLTVQRVWEINLSNNNLIGNLPSEIGNLSALEILILQDNQLSSNIPIELGNLNELQFVDLSQNQLTGPVHTEFANLSHLFWLNLQLNQLTGVVPSELGSLSNLTHLILSDNQLSNSIPFELGNLTELSVLLLGNNQLSGSIPPELGNLNNVDLLGLENNQLTGSIPPELGNLSRLNLLWINDNQLSGCYDLNLLNICPNNFTNAVISDGNNFEAHWEDFCASGGAADNDNDGLLDICECDGDYIVINGSPLPTGTLKMNEYIESAGTVQSPDLVQFEAEDYIELKPNFEVQSMATFIAAIENCSLN